MKIRLFYTSFAAKVQKTLDNPQALTAQEVTYDIKCLLDSLISLIKVQTLSLKKTIMQVPVS
jgi:hypothetical protein